MLIFIAGLQGIPEHLYEAAKIDGANGRQLFFYITLPLLRPTMLFVTVTGVIAQFQVFGQPFIMTTGGPGRASYTVILLPLSDRMAYIPHGLWCGGSGRAGGDYGRLYRSFNSDSSASALIINEGMLR